MRRPGAMAAIRARPKVLEGAIKDIPGCVVPANFNSPGQIVVSGRSGFGRAAARPCSAAGARKVVRLPVSGAFPFAVEYALDGLKEGLAKAAFKPVAPVIAPTWMLSPTTIRLSSQNWRSSVGLAGALERLHRRPPLASALPAAWKWGRVRS